MATTELDCWNPNCDNNAEEDSLTCEDCRIDRESGAAEICEGCAVWTSDLFASGFRWEDGVPHCPECRVDPISA
jgi:hypothetical protein